jgi:hypothetical protein
VIGRLWLRGMIWWRGRNRRWALALGVCGLLCLYPLISLLREALGVAALSFYEYLGIVLEATIY